MDSQLNISGRLGERRKEFIILLIILLVISLFLWIQSGIFSKGNQEFQGSLIINEYVTSNFNTLRDENWNSPDWIELFNNGKTAIWLGDIYISDDAETPEKALLPDYTLEPGDYFLVFASGKTSTNQEPFHVPFKLGQGDQHILLTRNQETLDIQELETLPTDISKGRLENGKWVYFATPTPDSQNDTPGSPTKAISPVWPIEKTVIISEYMTDNVYTYVDSNGRANDWVELYNTSDSPVPIGNMFLSDNLDVQNKFNLPDYEMKPGEYLIISLSSREDTSDRFTAPFSLGGDDSQIVLSDNSGYAIDMLEIFALPEGVSAGQTSDGEFGFYAAPTPGEANSKTISPTKDITPERKPQSGLIINEFMPNNRYGILDAYGKSSDWIEIYNPTDTDVPLDGFALSDDAGDPLKWQFPENAVLPAGEFLVVFASGNDETVNGEYHTNFSLSSDDDILLLSEPNTAAADSMVPEQLPGNASKGKTPEGDIVYFSVPTPGRKNDTHPNHHLESDIEILLGDLYISEVAASKIDLNRTGYQGLEEYIELHNDGSENIHLSGYSLSEGPESEYIFGDLTIEAGQYLLLLAKGGIPAAGESIEVENIRLNGAGETLILKDHTGKIIDYLETGYLLDGYSFGRSADNKYKEVFYDTKTPGEKNSDREFTSTSEKPTFSVQGGIVAKESIEVELNAGEGAVIKFTTNGNEPTFTDQTYTEPIIIHENTVIRAVAFSDGKLPSAPASRTYIFEKTHDIPILCISSNSYGLFSDDHGIYADGKGHSDSEFPYYDSNFWWDAERPASIEYYETDGKLALDFNAGIQIFGGFSRALAQKSFIIHLRDEYGLDELYYPFFKGSDGNQFKKFILRNGGQDTRTKMKDYYISKLAIEEGNQDGMRGQPVAVYINGEYWGIYNLRERIDEDYLSYHYNLDPDDINIIAANGVALHGNNQDWLELKQFSMNSDFTRQENYEKLANWIDIENFTDYIIFQTFFSNADTGNIKFWRDQSKTMKWRVLFYDVDLSLRDKNYYDEVIQRMFGQSGEYIGYSAHIQQALIQNPHYREYFLQRYAYYLTEVFTDKYLESGIEEIADTMKNEMVYQTERWKMYGTYEQWLESVDKFINKALGRGEIVAGLLQDFLNVSDDKMKELIPWYQPGQSKPRN